MGALKLCLSSYLNTFEVITKVFDFSKIACCPSPHDVHHASAHGTRDLSAHDIRRGYPLVMVMVVVWLTVNIDHVYSHMIELSVVGPLRFQILVSCKETEIYTPPAKHAKYEANFKTKL